VDKGKLSAREEALLAEARREAATGEGAQERPAPTATERLAQLMADERAQTLEKKRKMRRYGLTISGAIAALFVLWLLRVMRRR
jgi:hypothetical protein